MQVHFYSSVGLDKRTMYTYNKSVLRVRFIWEVIGAERIVDTDYTERGFQMKAQFITAEEVQQVLGVSRSKAYQIVQGLNRELKAAGYITLAGKCPVQYFKQKFYGVRACDTDRLGAEAQHPDPAAECQR